MTFPNKGERPSHRLQQMAGHDPFLRLCRSACPPPLLISIARRPRRAFDGGWRPTEEAGRSATTSRVCLGSEEVIVTPNHPLYGRTNRLFDAAGVEIKLCVWADTETGGVTVAVRDDEGRFEWTVDDTGEEVIRTRWASFRPPLVLVPAGGSFGSPA